jgi:excisionase family DNA binding protein
MGVYDPKKGSASIQANRIKSHAIGFTDLGFSAMLKCALNWFSKGLVMSDRWVSVEEIAEYLGVSKDTVYGWIAKKDMPAHKVGRLWKFKTDEVDDWVRNGKASDDLKENEGAEPVSHNRKHAGGEKADG